MGDVSVKDDKLEKKYKDILSYKELIHKVDEFEQRLKAVQAHSKSFDDELKVLKDKEQKKVIEF